MTRSRPSAPARGELCRFGDVVRQGKERVDPESSGYARYVAGEHMDTDMLRIRRWGTIGDGYLGPAFHRGFRAGQVLYGSRRTYLRKVAVPDFDGICANTTFVCEADDERLLPELLPFVMQTESFHAHSIGRSKGSVNPYINWRDIADYEFWLPRRDVQLQAIRVLQQAEQALTAYEDAHHAALKAEQALADEMFTPPSTDSGWRRCSLDEVTTKIVDGVHKRPNYTEEGIPFITVENLTRGRGVDFQDVRFVSEADHQTFIKRTHPERGDVLVSKDGTLGVARLVETDRPFSIFVSVALLKPNPELLDGQFLQAYFRTSAFKRHLRQRVAGSALKHIHLVDFRSAPIAVPPLKGQLRIAAALRAIAETVDELAAHVSRVQSTKEALLREFFPPLDRVV